MTNLSEQNIIILGDAISNKNGGSASFVELCLSLQSVCNLTVATRLGRFDHIFYRHPEFRLVKKNLYSFSTDIYDLAYRSEKFSIRKINKFTNPKLNHSNYQNCQLIIDCYGVDAKKLRSRYQNAVKIVRMHNGSVEAFANFFGCALGNGNKDNMLRYKAMMQQYDGLIFQTKEQLTQAKTIIDKKMPMLTISPTANERRLKYLPKSTLNITKLRFVQIASIQPRKNQLSSLKFISDLKKIGIQASVRFVGPIEDGDYLKKLKTYIEQNSLHQSVRFEGYKKDYMKFYTETDVVLIPSKAEGISRTLREALFLEKPVIAMATDGIRSLIQANIILSIDDQVFLDGDLNAMLTRFELTKEKGKIYYEENYSEQKYCKRISEQLGSLT